MIDPQVFNLSMEQEFLLKQYETESHRLSREDARVMLIELARQMMIKDNVIRDVLRHSGF